MRSARLIDLGILLLTSLAVPLVYRHPEHLLVVAAGNAGADADQDGVIDADSIGSPATAKNVLAVGASESDRPSTSASCSILTPASRCWSSYVCSGAPISGGFVSDNPAGLAAFSSRGPTDDGRIKPDLVAPGTNIISSRSHASGASYDDIYDGNYDYESGTSMATPVVSGGGWQLHPAGARGQRGPRAADLRPGGARRQRPAGHDDNAGADAVSLPAAGATVSAGRPPALQGGTTQAFYTNYTASTHRRDSLGVCAIGHIAGPGGSRFPPRDPPGPAHFEALLHVGRTCENMHRATSD
jgi:hypothetical protein